MRRIETVVRELKALRNAAGLIIPKDAVRWARKHPTSALYAHLEWSDKVAAEAYRVDQVRKILQIYVENAGVVQREFVSLSIDRHSGGYREQRDVLNAPDLRQILLADAIDDLCRMRERFRMLKELRPIWAAIDSAQLKLRPNKAA